MNKPLTAILTVAAVLIGLIFYLVYVSAPTYDWTEHYYYKSDDPYGTLFIVELLKDLDEEKDLKLMTKSFESYIDSADARCDFNYVFIGDEYYLPKNDQQYLFRCIEKGATALVSANTFNAYDWDLFNCYLTQNLWDTIAVFNFLDEWQNSDSIYTIQYQYQNQVKNYPWRVFNINDTCDVYKDFEALGYELLCNEWNFIEIRLGNGKLLLHSTPIAFSNLQLKKRALKDYCEVVMSHFGSGDIYWDEYHKVSRSGIFDQQQLAGPLQYILSQTSLRWAWYLLITILLVYILFKSKREQRVIPVIETRKNTSLEFVKTIGKLYELENDHRKLVIRKMDLFLTFIRDRLNISTSQINDELIEKLSVKTGKKRSEVRTLFDLYFTILKSEKLNDRVILRFNRLLERFYKDLY
ncbi:MAG: hypothetical protein HKN22_08410 [Bacteroidia bacterium]|nr:hypothetical protein [Bacteroidia bacterium]